MLPLGVPTSAGTGVPIGTVLFFLDGTAPVDKWLKLDGSEYAEADYPGLFALYGTRYNTGGETADHFRVPDWRGRFPIGAGTGTGLSARALGDEVGAGASGAGAESVTLTEANLPPLDVTVFASPGTGSGVQGTAGGGSGTATDAVNASGTSTAVDKMPPFAVVELYVKALAGPDDTPGGGAAGGGGGSGEANTSSNSGGGQGLALAKSGTDLPFKSITAGTGITLTPSATELEIAASGGGSFDATAIGSDVEPDTDDTYDLGNPSFRWQDLYLSGNLYADDGVYLRHIDGATGIYWTNLGTVSVRVSGSDALKADTSSVEFPKPVYCRSKLRSLTGTGTVASGSIACGSYVVLEATSEGGSGADDIDTITGGTAGQFLFVKAASGSTPTLKDGTGNLNLGADVTLQPGAGRWLHFDGTSWSG